MQSERTTVEGAGLGAHYKMSFLMDMAHAFCRVTRQQDWAEQAYMNESMLCELSLQNGTCILYRLRQGERMAKTAILNICKVKIF